MSSSLSDPTRNRSNSEEDAELPTHDRKRARLSESGDRESVLPRPAASTPPLAFDSPTSPTMQPEIPGPIAKPPLPPRIADSMATPSPTSKVTINTRPLSSQSMNMTDVTPPNESTADAPAGAHEAPTVDDESPQEVDTTASETLTVGRSPSPPIEAAEPEDFDRDPAETRWTTHLGRAIPTIQQYHVFQTFPSASEFRPGESRLAVHGIARTFADPRKDDEDTFRQVKDWFTDFTLRCDMITLDIINEDTAFWRQLPALLDRLCIRDQRSPSPIGVQAMIDFFVAYGRLCRLMIDFDTMRLSSLQSDAPNSDYGPLGIHYLQPFHRIFEWIYANPETRSALFFDSLRQHHKFDLMTLVTPFAEAIAQPLLASLLNYIKALKLVLLKVPAPHKELMTITAFLALATQLVFPVFFLSQEYCAFGIDHPQQDTVRELIESAVGAMDEIIQLGIKKQHPWLSHDNKALILIDRLNVSLGRLAAEIPRLGKSIIHASGVTYDDADLTGLVATMGHAWKFMIYLKLIKHGRMELRVSGLQSLCTDLISMFNSRILPYTDGNQDPLVKFTIRFLRQSNIVGYLVGPDSHPQLISRAGNLLGFFGVSGNYDDADTDSIWEAIVGSSDARGAAELWSMLRDALSTMEAQHLYHVCNKLCELPYHRWNAQIVELTEFLLGEALQRKLYPNHAYWLSVRVDPVVRRLSLKLIRDSLHPTTCDSDLSLRIRFLFTNNWIGYFKGMSDDTNKLTMSVDEETDMLSEIRLDIEAHNISACGSIYAVLQILHNGHLAPPAVQAVIEKCGLPRSLVDDLAYISSSVTDAHAKPQPYVQFECRLDCLLLLMRTVPEQFDLGCIESLWSSVLVSPQIDQKVRNRAWEHLTSLVNVFRMTPNAVAETVLQHFWPRLRPRDINAAVLNFAKHGVAYETASTERAESADGEIVQIPGLARVKQIMLDAEPGTVEGAASEFMIEQYLRNPILARRPKIVVHATHLDLIDHWVGAVLASAAQLKSLSEPEESMQMIASEDEIQREERHFDRSLLFLRRFTEAIKGNPGCSPLSPKQEAALPDFPGVKGPTRELIIEISSNKYVGKGEKRVAVGSENTGSELWEYLATVTGFSSFRVFHLGQSIVLQDEQKTISELNITAKVQVQKTPDATESTPRKRLRSSSPVDEKIMLHFDDLYGLLEAEDRLAKEVYTFLTITSVRKEVSHKLRGMDTVPSLVLPCDKPYKLLFCVQALRTCIEEESFSTTPDLVFVRYAIEALTIALAKLGAAGFESSLQMHVAYEVMDTLLLAFRTKVPHGTGRGYVADRAEFVRHIVTYTSRAYQLGGAAILPQSPEKPVRVGVEVLLEATLHDDRMWEQMSDEDAFAKVLQDALIVDADERVRQAVVDVLMGLTGQAGLKNIPKANDPRAARSRHDSSVIESCLLRIWKLLTALLPVAQASSFQCQQFFDATLGTLRRVGKVLDSGSLQDTLPVWSDLLLAHNQVEIVGQPLADRFVGGAAPIVQEIARLLRLGQSLPKQSDLLRGIIKKFLRPPLSAPGADTLALPILDSGVRESLYGLLLTLSEDAADLEMLVVEFGEDFDISDYLPGRMMNDRLALRSEIGYGGLRNLSNTCYLNSLLSQLFMNVQFRELVLQHGAQTPDRKLVWELSKVFSWMQGCHDKAVDPTAAVESITTWDGEQIDVTVQMDVDEFFNLLFDRLECQIADPIVRAQMKSLYGGETIQQIKSKECEHISERPETFSVLPVEIKGRASLQESLQAYVAGEVLQGDNKYSCTSCGKHVDAVKRSCLKHVPDNLIFNLKRFDFDLVTFMRAKLNDQFEFPETLDMAPYQLDSLNGADESQTPDIFELTGIIVHSGTAETGHYYSYIRQRPSSGDTRGSWVEFNDADVSAFDPSRIADCCFGGVDPSLYGIAKYYSAYMLFYQRRSSIEETAKRYPAVEPGNPLRLEIAPDVKGYMDQMNEMFVRAYCMQDPVYARFIRDLLRRVGDLDSGDCSGTHEVEHAALHMTLDYMHKVSSRWKSLPDLEATANIIKTRVGRCTDCAWHCLGWYGQHQSVILDCIVDGAYGAARKAFCTILLTSLQVMQKAIDEQELTTEGMYKYHDALERIVSFLHQGFLLVTRTSRCWPDYFPLIVAISNLGFAATKLVVQTGFVERCFEIIYLHMLDAPSEPLHKALRMRYGVYVALREKHRMFNHFVLVQCFAHLLSKIKLDVDWTAGEDYDVLALSDMELVEMGFDQNPPRLGWLQRLIQGRQAPEPAAQIVASIAKFPVFARDLFELLRDGLNHRDMPVAAAFVEPTLAFCEQCSNEHLIRELVDMALDSVDSISIEYAPEYLRLVQGVTKMGSDVEEMLREEGWLLPLVNKQMTKWAPTLLFGLNEATCHVRNETLQLVSGLLFLPLEQSQDVETSQYVRLRTRARELCLSVARCGRSNFLAHNPRENQSMQVGHFNEALEVMERCYQAAYADISTASEEQALSYIDDVMNQLRSKRESVIELLNPNEYEGSSDMEVLSELEGEEFNSSPAC